MTCSRCGAGMPADSPEQLCPRCLLAAAIDSGSTAAAPIPVHGFAAPSVEELRHLFPALEVLELLGKGGMGVVYKAKQIALDRLVALKILPAGNDSAFAERFVREARALARLNHPNIVAVHDFGRSGNQVYFVMEYVDGVNLRQAMRAGELGPAEALKIVPQICDALQFAHDEGIVHRDIKPENILLDKKGRVKIADFGLAKLLGVDAPDTALTGTRQGMGTLHYMAPEQLEGAKSVDHRADIYSLGVTFYEMLTGELPLGRFAAPSHKAAIDARLDDVVFRSLEKEPGNRYQHASEVKSEVETISRTPPPSALPSDAVQTQTPVPSPFPPRTNASQNESDPLLAVPTRSSVWMKVPWIVRFLAKTVLTLGSLGLFLAFVSFFAQSTVGANGEKQSVIRVGLPDPWLVWTSHPNGFSHEIFINRWSMAAGLLAGVAFWLLLVVDRIERRARHPNLAAAVVAEAREIAGYLLASGVAYLIAGVVLIVFFNLMESTVRNNPIDNRAAQLHQVMQVIVVTWMIASFVTGILQIISSTKLSKLQDGLVHRAAAIAGIVSLTPLWFCGLSLGIWVLRYLNRPEVRAALESRERETTLAERRIAAERETAPGWAFLFGWLVGVVWRTLSHSRGMFLTASMIGIALCLLPWVEMHFSITNGRGMIAGSGETIAIPGTAYWANQIVLAGWVMIAFITAATWPRREPSMVRGMASAALALVIGFVSFSVLSEPYLPARPNLYAPVMKDIQQRAPELIVPGATDLSIIERALGERLIVSRLTPLTPLNLELILAVLCLLLAAVELQRAMSRAAASPPLPLGERGGACDAALSE